MKKLLLFVCSLQLLITFGEAFTCVPSADCTLTGQLVADPDNCYNYFYCIGNSAPSAGPVQCPDNQYYDTSSGNCEYGRALRECGTNDCVSAHHHGCVYECRNSDYIFISDGHNCSVYHVCSPPAPNAQVLECTSPNLFFNGEICVSDSSQCCNSCYPYCNYIKQIADPCDCRGFFLCTQIGPVDFDLKGHCATGTYFDEGLQACVTGTDCQNECLSVECIY